MGRLFGTDGVRGEANKDLTPELAFKIGKAAAFVLKKNKESLNVLIGIDTRVSSNMLESALTAGMCSVGANVLTVGVLPTPAIAYLVRRYQMDAGVVISASHNSFEDNGIKFFGENGYKLSDEIEDEIENYIFNKLDDIPRANAEEIGFKESSQSAVKYYTEFLESCMEGMRLDGLNIALDCANGATYKSAPIIMKRLGANIKVINDKPNGLNINKNCGSTHMEGLQKFVIENKCDIGIAYDGDGDRCLVVDELGNILDGDQIMSICGNYLKKQGKLKKDTIVVTVMSNLGFFIMGEENNIKIEKSKVGDRYVLEKMLENNCNLGGEQSGHIIFLDYNTTGDGILTSLQLLRILKLKGKKLSEINKYMKVMPQVLLNAKVSNDKKYSYMDNITIRNEIKALEDKFANEGRILIRPSGTEPLIRVMLEGSDKDLMMEEAKRIVNLLETLL